MKTNADLCPSPQKPRVGSPGLVAVARSRLDTSRARPAPNIAKTVSVSFVRPLDVNLVFAKLPMRTAPRFFSYPRLYLLLFAAVTPGFSAQDGFRSIFNGRDLNGWEGNPTLWSVSDGAITGTTQGPETLTYNQFLIWRGGTVKNFELRAKVKQAGSNTGIQYRSKELPAVGAWSIGGYQCDIHPATKNNAMLYEERGRAILAQNGQTIVIDPQGVKWLIEERAPVDANVTEWNEYVIIAQGNRLIHKLNGKVTVDVTDHDAKARAFDGLLAFQIHRGPAMKVQIKDVMLKELPAGAGLTPFDSASIPPTAKKLTSPAPAAAKAKVAKAAAPQAADPEKSRKKKSAPETPPAATAEKTVGPAIGENKATPISRLKVAKDFKVELIYSVPGVAQGSWVNLCVDNKGRIIASDQFGGLYRFAPPPPGKPLDPAKVEKVPADIRAVNGMLWAFGALYVGVNDYEKKITSGLYRLTDSDGDDQLDKVELLRAIEASGDHGVHAILPTPDGRGLYLVTGNSAKMTAALPSSQVPALWGEDHLLPRMPDGRGFMRDVLAPGGIIYRVTPDGKDFEIYASGFRNIFDASLNREGELFTYDADMEYDFNTSWYRPTRVNHVVSGAEFGWRNGAGKRPSFYADNLPPVIDIGPGSPTGTTFGYGAKFPARYQNALFVLDWSWGKMHALHLQPDGSTYKAVREEFISGFPLPLTDAIIHPADGAMYFAIGGRRVQSGLYRVTYTGRESTAPVQVARVKSVARDLRHQLETFHGRQNPEAVKVAWPHLESTDRFIRWAARTAIEHQPFITWAERALSETNPSIRVEALLGLARAAGISPPHRQPQQPPIDKALGRRIVSALEQIDWNRLDMERKLAWLRTIEVALHRFGPFEGDIKSRWVTKLDPLFPAATPELNWLLCETLVYLESPTVAKKGMALIAAAPNQEEQIEYARSLRMLKTGWDLPSRTAYLEWFLKAANYRGGASFTKFIEFIRNDALLTFTPAEQTALAALIAKEPARLNPIENFGAVFAGRPSKNWTLEQLSAAAGQGMKGRNFEQGRKMFGAAACFACHRFGNQGGMTGPDLTGAGGRYNPHDLLDQILNPSKEINEQFVPSVLTQNDGETVTGVVVNLNGDTVTINTDLSDPNQRVGVDRKEVKSIEPSKVSPMPPMLLSSMTETEILDLLAYVLSGDNRDHPMFKK